jgi:regulator of nucleoside diphosphate kinase
MLTHNDNIIVTTADRQRLGSLLIDAERLGLVERRYLDDLLFELERATPVDPQQAPDDVITINSTVRLRDLDSGEVEEYTLVYPRQADVLENRISVLAPLGTALLGYRAGETIEWPVPGGTLRMVVEEVTYQPERAGDFSR